MILPVSERRQTQEAGNHSPAPFSELTLLKFPEIRFPDLQNIFRYIFSCFLLRQTMREGCSRTGRRMKIYSFPLPCPVRPHAVVSGEKAPCMSRLFSPVIPEFFPDMAADPAAQEDSFCVFPPGSAKETALRRTVRCEKAAVENITKSLSRRSGGSRHIGSRQPLLLRIMRIPAENLAVLEPGAGSSEYEIDIPLHIAFLKIHPAESALK